VITGGSRPRGGGSSFAIPVDEPSLPWLLAWLAATAGGLTLFILLGRNPNLEFATDDASPSGATETPLPTQGDGPTARRARRQLGDETQLPRWLRPSVQAARYSIPGRSAPED